jgi:tetratricopeptide (TPR) repeat protein
MNHLRIALALVAILLFAETLHARKNSSAVYREAARLAMAGDIDAAIPKFKEALAINPYYSTGHYGLGKAYLHREGKIKDAIRSLERAIRLDSKNAKGHFYLGIAYLMKEKYVKAVHAFDDAYRNDSTFIEALYNMGAAYDIMGYEGKAKKYFDLFYLKKEKVDRDVLF